MRQQAVIAETAPSAAPSGAGVGADGGDDDAGVTITNTSTMAPR